MKKNLRFTFAFLLFIGISNSNAQTYSFVFSQFSNAYTPLSSGTNVYGSTPWNSNSITNFPIGFNFNFQGVVNTSIDMLPGVIAFPPTLDSMGAYTFFASLTDTGSVSSKSPVTYMVSGSVGNRILKIQVADAGFDAEDSLYHHFSSVVNFQTWLYESDNSIEVHVGPSTIVHPLTCYPDSTNPGPSIGIIELDATQTNILYSLALSGNPAAPTTTLYNLASFNPVALNSTPANGTVYRFAQVISGIDENEKIFSYATLFPNPANENSTLAYNVKNSGDVSVIITDAQGRIISNVDQGNQVAGNYRYDVNSSGLSNGIYFVTLVSGGQKIMQKLSVAH